MCVVTPDDNDERRSSAQRRHACGALANAKKPIDDVVVVAGVVGSCGSGDGDIRDKGAEHAL